MAVIGELATLVTARTAQFERGMKRSRQSLGKFQMATKSAGAALARFAAPIAAAVTSFKLLTDAVKSVRENLPALDALAKQSARIGISVENLSRLQFAAELTGVSSTMLASAFDVMAKRLGEANRGGGAAKKALDELGLSASKLINMSPDQAFLTIADAISKMGTQSEKVAAVANIFSRSNLKLVNTLDAGRVGLGKMAAEADRLGATVSGNLKAIEDTNDAVFKMTAAWKAVGKDLTFAVAPALKTIADVMSDLLSDLRGVNKELPKFDQNAQRFSQDPTQPRSPFNFGASTPFAAFLPPNLRPQAREPLDATGIDRLLRGGRRGILGAIDMVAEKFSDLGKVMEEQVKIQKRGAQVTESLRTPIEIFRDRIKELTELRRRGGISAETFRRGVAAARSDALSTLSGRESTDTPLAGAAARGSAAAAQILARAGQKQENSDRQRNVLLMQIRAVLESFRGSETQSAGSPVIASLLPPG